MAGVPPGSQFNPSASRPETAHVGLPARVQQQLVPSATSVSSPAQVQPDGRVGVFTVHMPQPRWPASRGAG